MVSTRRCRLQRGAAVRARNRVHRASSATRSLVSKSSVSGSRHGGRGPAAVSSDMTLASRHFMATAHFVRQTQSVLERKKRTPRTNPDREDTNNEVQISDENGDKAKGDKDEGGGNQQEAEVVTDHVDENGNDSGDNGDDNGNDSGDNGDDNGDENGDENAAGNAERNGDDDDATSGHSEGDRDNQKGRRPTGSALSPSPSTQHQGRRTGTRLRTEAAGLRRDLTKYPPKAGIRRSFSPATATRSRSRAEVNTNLPPRLCSLQTSNAPPRRKQKQQQHKKRETSSNSPATPLETRSRTAVATSSSVEPLLTRSRAAAETSSVLSSSSPSSRILHSSPATRSKSAGKTAEPASSTKTTSTSLKTAEKSGKDSVKKEQGSPKADVKSGKDSPKKSSPESLTQKLKNPDGKEQSPNNQGKKRRAEPDSSAVVTGKAGEKTGKDSAKKPPPSQETNTRSRKAPVGQERSLYNPAKRRKIQRVSSTKRKEGDTGSGGQPATDTVAAAVAAATAALLAERRKRYDAHDGELDEEEEAWWSSSDDLLPMAEDGPDNEVERRNWFARRTIEQLCGRHRRRCRLSRQGKIGASRLINSSKLKDLVVEKEPRASAASATAVVAGGKTSAGQLRARSERSQLEKVGRVSVNSSTGMNGRTKPVRERSKGSSRAHQSPLSVLEMANGIGSKAASALGVATKETPSVWCIIQIPPQATPGQRLLVAWPDGSRSEVQCPAKMLPCRRLVVVKPGSPPPSQPAESVKLTDKEWTKGIEARLRHVYSTGFYDVLWPTLASLGWKAVDRDETGTGGRCILPPPASATNKNENRDGRFRDYYVRLNDVLKAIAPLAGEYAQVQAKFKAYLLEQELRRKERQERRRTARAAVAASSSSFSATAIDDLSETKEHDKKYLNPSAAPPSPRADYELPHLPPAGTYEKGTSSEGSLYDRIWDPARANAAALSFLDGWKQKDKELALLALHRADYQINDMNMSAATTEMTKKKPCM